MTLTTNSHARLYVGFTEDSMPLTFQHAIQIARALACPYLWIDAICILQDDPIDKAQEIGKICPIFSNAFVTISASRSTTFESGFLGVRPKVSKMTVYKVPFLLPGSPRGATGIAHLIKGSPENEKLFFDDELVDSPSHQRAVSTISSLRIASTRLTTTVVDA